MRYSLENFNIIFLYNYIKVYKNNNLKSFYKRIFQKFWKNKLNNKHNNIQKKIHKINYLLLKKKNNLLTNNFIQIYIKNNNKNFNLYVLYNNMIMIQKQIKLNKIKKYLNNYIHYLKMLIKE